MRLLIIGFGGFLGAISRYLLGGLIQTLTHRQDFPFATLGVNLLGCFLIGFLASLAEARQVFNPETRALIFVGFLGSFTTFSTFGLESVTLLKAGEFNKFIGYVGLHLFIGFTAVALGAWLAQVLWAK